mgnify:CR=1 FL=1
MTQKEFDDKMNEYRWQQTNETASLKLEVERLNSKRRALGQEMQALQQQISSVTAQRDALVLQIKEIGGKYWKLKNDLIRENPKAVPPTYAEAHAKAATC